MARRSLAVFINLPAKQSLTAMRCGKATKALHLSRFPIYNSTDMAKKRTQTEPRSVVHVEGRRHKPTRKYVLSLARDIQR